MADWAVVRGARALETPDRGRIIRGPRKGLGSVRNYHGLALGRSRIRSVEALGSVGPAMERPKSLLHVVHLADFQLADVQSPLRMEFLERHRSRTGLRQLLPAFRPQEALVASAAASVVRSVWRGLESPVTGAPIDFALSGGDMIDNAQANELMWYLALLDGGIVRSDSGGELFEGCQVWDDHWYWRPDPGTDRFKRAFGFPTIPGLLRRATEPLRSPGLSVPWLACHGNHDGLVRGWASPSVALNAIATGNRKAVSAPKFLEERRPMNHPAEFVKGAERYFAGPTRTVSSDSERRLVSRAEYAAAHVTATCPEGHGLAELVGSNRPLAFVHDHEPSVRVIVLDTVNPAGDAEGSIGNEQFHWLEERLAEVHSSFVDRAGRWTKTASEDRLVVISSHHGLSDLISQYEEEAGTAADDLPRRRLATVRALLHRFPNVVLWLAGHTHFERVTAWQDPSGRTGGFFELATPSVMDWPCQFTAIELTIAGRGEVAIHYRPTNHDAPLEPDDAEDDIAWIASLHRELAGNFLGFRQPGHGPASGALGRLILPVGDRGTWLRTARSGRLTPV